MVACISNKYIRNVANRALRVRIILAWAGHPSVRIIDVDFSVRVRIAEKAACKVSVCVFQIWQIALVRHHS